MNDMINFEIAIGETSVDSFVGFGTIKEINGISYEFISDWHWSESIRVKPIITGFDCDDIMVDYDSDIADAFRTTKTVKICDESQIPELLTKFEVSGIYQLSRSVKGERRFAYAGAGRFIVLDSCVEWRCGEDEYEYKPEDEFIRSIEDIINAYIKEEEESSEKTAPCFTRLTVEKGDRVEFYKVPVYKDEFFGTVYPCSLNRNIGLRPIKPDDPNYSEFKFDVFVKGEGSEWKPTEFIRTISKRNMYSVIGISEQSVIEKEEIYTMKLNLERSTLLSLGESEFGISCARYVVAIKQGTCPGSVKFLTLLPFNDGKFHKINITDLENRRVNVVNCK